MPYVSRGIRVRLDDLPERQSYKDTGCSVSKSCFTCPLEVCRYEVPRGLLGVVNLKRDAEIAAMRASGVSADAISKRLGVTRRTVFRVLQKKAAA